MKKELSICIPTYNRKNNLIHQLNSLIYQEGASFVNIFVIDNCSNYDVEKSINEAFGKDRTNNIFVIRNKTNIGGSANIATTFFHCNTPWMWLLGDDDESSPNSIKTILEDINCYKDATLLKYSIKDFYPYHNEEVSNWHDFIEIYKSGKHTTGDMIFMSNMVYNMEKLKPYLGNVFMRCSTRIAQLMPIFDALDKNDATIIFRDFPIVKYIYPEPGQHWSRINVEMGLSSISKYHFNCSDEDFRWLSYILIRNFSHGEIINHCKELPTKFKALYSYRTIYNDTLRYSPHKIDKVYYYAFCFQLKTGIKTYSLANYLYHKYCRIRKFFHV